jgi:hypothetical protein
MAACAVHPGKRLEVFCFTCNRLVCRQCAVVAHKSPAHDVGELAPMAAKVRVELHELAAAVGVRGPGLRAGRAGREAATAEVDVQERTATAASVDYFTVLQRAVRTARDQSAWAITAEGGGKRAALTAQHQRVETVAEHVEEAAELAAFLLASGSAAQLLAARQSLLPGLRWLKQLVCVTAPTVPSTLKFVLSAADAALATTIARAGAVCAGDGADPTKCELSGEGLGKADVGVEATFEIAAFGYDGIRRTTGGDDVAVQFQLVVPGGGGGGGGGGAASGGGGGSDESAKSNSADAVVKGQVKDLDDGRYQCCFTVPVGCGDDVASAASDEARQGLLTVLVQGMAVSGSPFAVAVSARPAVVGDSVVLLPAFAGDKGVNQLVGWITATMPQFAQTKVKLGLLFRASRDGWKVADFHRCCDGKGPTVVVVRSESGHVFGGATDGSWNSAGGWTQAAAFLFGLQTQGNGSQPVKLALKPGKEGKAMHNDPSYGPTFGGGLDLHVSNDANTTNTKSTSFQNGNNTYEDAGLGKHFFTGSKYFQVAEYEVFAIAHV